MTVKNLIELLEDTIKKDPRNASREVIMLDPLYYMDWYRSASSENEIPYTTIESVVSAKFDETDAIALYR